MQPSNQSDNNRVDWPYPRTEVFFSKTRVVGENEARVINPALWGIPIRIIMSFSFLYCSIVFYALAKTQDTLKSLAKRKTAKKAQSFRLYLLLLCRFSARRWDVLSAAKELQLTDRDLRRWSVFTTTVSWQRTPQNLFWEGGNTSRLRMLDAAGYVKTFPKEKLPDGNEKAQADQLLLSHCRLEAVQNVIPEPCRQPEAGAAKLYSCKWENSVQSPGKRRYCRPASGCLPWPRPASFPYVLHWPARTAANTRPFITSRERRTDGPSTCSTTSRPGWPRLGCPGTFCLRRPEGRSPDFRSLYPQVFFRPGVCPDPHQAREVLPLVLAGTGRPHTEVTGRSKTSRRG